MSRSFDFSDETKTRIAGRAGYICTYPDCGLLTIGPHPDDPSKYQLLGQAAHIRSGAPNGPRSAHGKLTDAQLAAVSNGLWLCAKHHYMIDLKSKGLEQRYTAALLVSWRLVHEASVEVRTQSQDPRGFFSITQIRLYDNSQHDPTAVETPVSTQEAGRTSVVLATDAFEAEHHLDAILGPSQWRHLKDGRPRTAVDIAYRIPELRTLTSRGERPSTHSPAVVVRPNRDYARNLGHSPNELVDRADYRALGEEALYRDVNALDWCDVELSSQNGEQDWDVDTAYVRFTSKTSGNAEALPLSHLGEEENAQLSIAIAFLRARHLARETPTVLGIDSPLLNQLSDDAYRKLIAELEGGEARLQTFIACTEGGRHAAPDGWQVLRMPPEARMTDTDYAAALDKCTRRRANPPPTNKVTSPDA